ncbi:MAG: hypothetical protein CUN55_09050 [Phototrophicales bacterium]|nr:MAG: hypothetical protein CUN55_09050 [Phototrophicales bacterium]
MSEHQQPIERLQTLIDCLQKTLDDEADCIEFDLEMDCLAEWLASGADPTLVVKPRIQAHLAHSRDCAEELEVLIAILRAEQNGLLDDIL